MLAKCFNKHNFLFKQANSSKVCRLHFDYNFDNEISSTVGCKYNSLVKYKRMKENTVPSIFQQSKLLNNCVYICCMSLITNIIHFYQIPVDYNSKMKVLSLTLMQIKKLLHFHYQMYLPNRPILLFQVRYKIISLSENFITK